MTSLPCHRARAIIAAMVHTATIAATFALGLVLGILLTLDPSGARLWDWLSDAAPVLGSFLAAAIGLGGAYAVHVSERNERQRRERDSRRQAATEIHGMVAAIALHLKWWRQAIIDGLGDDDMDARRQAFSQALPRLEATLSLRDADRLRLPAVALMPALKALAVAPQPPPPPRYMDAKIATAGHQEAARRVQMEMIDAILLRLAQLADILSDVSGLDADLDDVDGILSTVRVDSAPDDMRTAIRSAAAYGED